MGTAIQTPESINITLPEQKRFTPQEFLVWERKQRLKHEFIDGKIYTKGGSSKKHNKITFNINGLLWFIQQTLTNFEAFTTDMRTYAPLKKSYFYPDIVVVKGQDEYLDNAQNDWVIGEILQSPSDVLKIKSLPIELRLSDIYRGVDFNAKR